MTQLDLLAKAQARDATLESLARIRAHLIESAVYHARELCRLHGTTTSPEVLESMRQNGWAEVLKQVDARFMGAALLPSKGFERVGFKRNGSKGRPTTEWRLAR